MKLYAIGGMPRAGSTLLCDILNQNPQFTASSTSPLSTFAGGLVQSWSNSVEVKAELNINREKTEDKVRTSLRAFIETWHDGEVVFDKSRGWNINSLLFFDLYPESRIIVPVRDLRAIMASCEKQHRKTPMFDDSPNALGKTLMGRASYLFADEGLIGKSLMGVEDMVRRNDPRVVFVQYETLVEEPESTMKKLYEALGEKAL